MPTSSSSSIVRFRDSALSIFIWSSSASLICRLIVSTGFSEVIGSWKIIDTFLPRMERTSSSSIFSTSCPSKTTAPSTIFPGGFGMSRISDSAVTDFPHPDSPTMPSVSPAASSNETPSTAWTTPSRVKNCVVSSRTSRRFCATFFPRRRLDLHPRIERVTEPVAEERERQHHDRDADRGEQHHRRLAGDLDPPLVDHDTPRRCRRLDPDADERERGLGEDRRRDDERHLDDHRRERVGHEVPGHDAGRPDADAPGGLDELLLA